MAVAIRTHNQQGKIAREEKKRKLVQLLEDGGVPKYGSVYQALVTPGEQLHERNEFKAANLSFSSSIDAITVKNSDDDEARVDVALALDDDGVAVPPNSFISDAPVAQKVLARQAEYCSSQSLEMHRATLMQLRALQV